MPAPLKTEASLETLPTEILCKIFTLLDAQFIVEVVSKLCTRFARVLGDDSFWQAKLAATWPNPYPVPVVEDFDWKEACIEREQQFNQWTNWEDEMRSVHIREAHIGTIHSVLLMNGSSTCVTGSRDRSLKIWSFGDQEVAAAEDRLLHSVHEAHAGWIWTLHSMGNTLISSSFDFTLKLWDVECGLRELKSFTMDKPALAMSRSDGEMILGCLDGKVYHYDPREPGEPSPFCSTLRNAIICMAADDRVVLAGTTGSRMYTIDRRCLRVRRDLHMSFKDYPTALSFDSRQLWMGTRNGSVHVIDMTTSPCKILQTADLSSLKAQRGTVTGIRHTLGSVLVSFERAPMVVLEPTLNPAVIFKGPEQQRVTRFDFEGGTLAVALSEDLEIWRPKCEAEAV
uniref:Putative cdc4 n=1 Tax=Amblyomma aureolatum TaxID=187763 RepID=A0A1E1X3H1_9ACAR